MRALRKQSTWHSGWIAIGRALLLAALAGLAWPASAAPAENPDDLLIVANRTTKVSDVSLTQLKQLFLCKRRSWPNGERVIVVNAKAGSRARSLFRRAVLDMSPVDEARYWQERKIKGGIIEPPSFSNVLKAVFKIKGSLGYVRRAKYMQGVVKLLLVVPALKQEPKKKP